MHRGVYTAAAPWAQSPPWERHAAATIARSSAEPGSVFCRETALSVHGVEQVWDHRRVQVRTATKGSEGLQQAADTWSDEHAARRVWDMARRPNSSPHPPVTPRLEYLPLWDAWREATYSPSTVPLRFTSWAVDPRGGTPRSDGTGFTALTDPLALAVADVICRVPLEQALAVVDSVLSGRTAGGQRLTVSEIQHWVDLIPIRRKRERATLALGLGDARAESPGESTSRAQIWEAGLLMPELQTTHRLEDGRTVRPDMEWREAGVIGEFDGLIKYSRSATLSGQSADQVVVEEKRREEALNRADRRVIRWTWADLKVPGRVPGWLLAAGVPLR